MTSRPVALRLPGLRLRHTTMKIVIAPDSYKESLSATEVAQAIEKGFREIFPMLITCLFPLLTAEKVRLKR